MADGARSLVVVKAIRQALYFWTGCEDVMKVFLEMAKRVYTTHSLALPHYELAATDRTSFKYLVRSPSHDLRPGTFVGGKHPYGLHCAKRYQPVEPLSGRSQINPLVRGCGRQHCKA
jgi:hypothetical protein